MMEIVNGVIIGDVETTMRGMLYFNGRPQSRCFWGNSDSEITERAMEYITEMKDRLGDEFYRIYPDGLELRIYDN